MVDRHKMVVKKKKNHPILHYIPLMLRPTQPHGIVIQFRWQTFQNAMSAGDGKIRSSPGKALCRHPAAGSIQ